MVERYLSRGLAGVLVIEMGRGCRRSAGNAGSDWSAGSDENVARMGGAEKVLVRRNANLGRITVVEVCHLLRVGRQVLV